MMPESMPFTQLQMQRNDTAFGGHKLQSSKVKLQITKVKDQNTAQRPKVMGQAKTYWTFSEDVDEDSVR